MKSVLVVLVGLFGLVPNLFAGATGPDQASCFFNLTRAYLDQHGYEKVELIPWVDWAWDWNMLYNLKGSDADGHVVKIQLAGRKTESNGQVSCDFVYDRNHQPVIYVGR